MNKYTRISLVILLILAAFAFMGNNHEPQQTTDLLDEDYSVPLTQFPPSSNTPTPPPTDDYYFQYDNSVPVGVTAKCNDGTYSYSQNSRGTCSHHGGVAEWY